jgi:MFS superfamily sulfate permease-like transporter
VAALGLLAGLMVLPRIPAAPVMIACAVAAGAWAGLVHLPQEIHWGWSGLPLTLPSTLAEVLRAMELLIVPQLPLTLTNAVIVTALVCRDLYPGAPRATERNLALTTGVANLALSPLGAMPMCHGAGGAQAQHRFGARTGLAPVLLGGVLLALGAGFAGSAAAMLAVIPIGAVGALLLVAGADLALSRRLFDAQPSCWPVIAVAAAATLLANPAVGLVAGCLGEIVRKAVLNARGKGASQARKAVR